MIVSTTRVHVRPENRKELIQTIWPLLDPIRNESGCLTYGCYVDLVDENSTVLIGEWETQADLHQHFRSRDFAVLFGAINALTDPDDVDVKLLSSIDGIENTLVSIQGGAPAPATVRIKAGKSVRAEGQDHVE